MAPDNSDGGDMRKSVLLSFALAGILFFASCSGSDSGGSSGGSSKVKLTANNVSDVTQSAFQTTNAMITGSGAVSEEIGRSGEEKDELVGRNIIAGFGFYILDFLNETGALMSDNEEAYPDGRSRTQLDDLYGTKQGLYGGSATYSLSKQGNSFKLSIVFDDYTSYPETYLDGTLILTGTFDSASDAPTGKMNISFNGFRIKHANNYDYTLAGTMAMEGDTTGAVFTANASVKDQLKGTTSRVENYVLDMMLQSSYMVYTVSGTFGHSTYGNVTLNTEEAFKQQLFAEHPVDGILYIEGGEGTQSRLIIIDSSSYKIEADLNGDGTFEWNSGTLYWAN